MKEVSEKSTRNYEEKVGKRGATLNIQKQTSGESVKMYATVNTKDGKEAAFASREEDGGIVLSIKKPELLNSTEFLEVFSKVGTCFAALLGIKEADAETEQGTE